MKDQQCQKGDKCTYLHVKTGGGGAKAAGGMTRELMGQE